MTARRNLQDKQHGVSLIEVMVALFVLAVGLLGVLAMQANAMKFNHSAYAYSQAAFLANDILEAMRSNPTAVSAYPAALNGTSIAHDCSSLQVQCTPEQLATWHVRNWRANVESRLIAGEPNIALDGPLIVITVRFDDRRVEPNNSNALPHEYVLVTEI